MCLSVYPPAKPGPRSPEQLTFPYIIPTQIVVAWYVLNIHESYGSCLRLGRVNQPRIDGHEYWPLKYLEEGTF